MSHIHLPDGVLPVWLWLTGIIIVGLYLCGLTLYLRNKKFNSKLALVGVFSALLIISMSIEIVPIAYHVKLVALAGIILGPLYSVLSLLIVNILLSLVGHGGITIFGLNTIVLAIEAIAAFLLFKAFGKVVKNKFITAFMATFIALIVGTFASVGVVYLGKAGIDTLVHVGEHKNKSLFSFQLFEHAGHSHNHSKEQDHHLASDHEDSHNMNHVIPDEQKSESEKSEFDFNRFLFIILTFGVIGWLLESTITGFIISYVNKIKPDLLEG